MIEEIKEHLSDYKWIYIIAIVILSLIGWWIWYEYAYPCAYGHYEDVWITTWCYNGTSSVPCGGYFSNEFVCDCRTVRDSVSVQNEY